MCVLLLIEKFVIEIYNNSLVFFIKILICT
jgi:hypothetical protein